MKKKQDLNFEDKSFPILIHAESTSQVGDPTTTLEAIHEAVEIKYFYEGTSTLLIGNRTLQVSAGDVVVINPYEFHSTVDYGNDSPGRYHCIMVGLDFFDGIRGADISPRHFFFGRKKVFKTKPENPSALADIVTKIVTEDKTADKFSRLSILGLVAELFAHLMRDGVTREDRTPSDDMVRGYAVIEPAVRMIRDRYREPFSVEMLAEACNVSKFHFSRVFKAVMAQSPIQYLISYRLAVADTLLSTTEMRVGEVAEQTGFSDVGYFSRMYKRQFGKTPGSGTAD